MSAAAERFFVDTNVLLYSVDPAGGGKRELAQQWADALWTSSAGRISWQVLNEFYANAVRKLRAPVQGVRTTVETLAQWTRTKERPEESGRGRQECLRYGYCSCTSSR